MVFTVLLLVLVTSSYFAVPAWLLHGYMDRLIFVGSDLVDTHEDQRWTVPVGPAKSVLVRLYGEDQSSRCVVFFPGQHGGIPNYERNLFPQFRTMGVSVYALSYPGYDGAPGAAQVLSLIPDVGKALSHIDGHTACRLSRAVFVGHSLGATVAVAAATQFRPSGILLDGASPSLADAVRAFMRRRTITSPWTVLPVQSLVKDEYPLVPQLRRIPTVPVRIFQGTADDVTPFADIRVAVESLPNVKLIPVPGARHENAYILGRAEYLRELSSLLGKL
jgi:alpha-beta hydrolase superfamily lysophospholipase